MHSKDAEVPTPDRNIPEDIILTWLFVDSGRSNIGFGAVRHEQSRNHLLANLGQNSQRKETMMALNMINSAPNEWP